LCGYPKKEGKKITLWSEKAFASENAPLFDGIGNSKLVMFPHVSTIRVQ
jgi:hypothetical protein